MTGTTRTKTTMSQIFKAMAAVMADMEAIGKDQKNQQQGFKYRGIDQVYNALHPLLAKHKIFTTPEVLEKQRDERVNKNGTVLAFVSLRIKYTFWCEDGSSVSCIVEGEGMDSGDKASNKAMAIGHKYALLQTFCIPTEDMDDPDAEVHEVQPLTISAKDLQTVRALMKDTDTEEEAFCQWLQVDCLESILATHVGNVLGALNKKKEAMKKGTKGSPNRLNSIISQQQQQQPQRGAVQ